MSSRVAPSTRGQTSLSVSRPSLLRNSLSLCKIENMGESGSWAFLSS